MRRRGPDVPESGVDLVVTAVGKRCPLTVGEIVRFADTWTVDFIGRTGVASIDVRRKDGSVVTLTRGDGGAILARPERDVDPRTSLAHTAGSGW